MPRPTTSIGTSLADKLVAALGMEPPAPRCPVQIHFDKYRKLLMSYSVQTPLPEVVHFLDENFPYLIQLENPNPHIPNTWVSANASIVVPLLTEGKFDQTGYRFESVRADNLLRLPGELRDPHCIHHIANNSPIGGDFIYVRYLAKKLRKSIFTTTHSKLGKVVVVSAFVGGRNHVKKCVGGPAVYVQKDFTCTCDK